jgi:hypothetical protein
VITALIFQGMLEKKQHDRERKARRHTRLLPVAPMDMLAELRTRTNQDSDASDTDSGDDEDKQKREAARDSQAQADMQDASVVSTDDMLPFFVYVTVLAHPKHLHANLAFMEDFRPKHSSPTCAVALVHLRAVIQYLQEDNISLESTKVSEKARRSMDTLLHSETTDSDFDLLLADTPRSSANKETHKFKDLFGMGNAGLSKSKSAPSFLTEDDDDDDILSSRRSSKYARASTLKIRPTRDTKIAKTGTVLDSIVEPLVAPTDLVPHLSTLDRESSARSLSDMGTVDVASEDLEDDNDSLFGDD